MRRLGGGLYQEVGSVPDGCAEGSQGGIRIDKNLGCKLWDCEFILARPNIHVRC
jgi:hypothetical protein